jgi:hypothetical protein
MECDRRPGPAQNISTCNAEGHIATEPDPRDEEPEEKVKQKKHTRVHKREKELHGLVTPLFLPLLDARDASPEKKYEKRPKSERAASADALITTTGTCPSRDAEKNKQGRKSGKNTSQMEPAASGDLGKKNQQANAANKSKRPTKSSLRHKDTPRSRRKRVSLIIDGQTVLPADTVVEPPLTSPSSDEATSTSNSTTSLDDMIDPRLTTSDAPVYYERLDAVHHSLPLPMANAIQASTKSLTKPPTEPTKPTSTTLQIENSPPSPLSPRSPSMPFGSVQTASRTFLDPSPAQQHPPSIPETAGPEPIYSAPTTTSAELDLDDVTDEEEHFDTYVGGLHGSGVDDVDQAGSYGYPSSLGASYLESYMQNRPLSVRMQAANRSGLDEREKRRLLEEKKREQEDEEDSDEEDDAFSAQAQKNTAQRGQTDEDNFMGDMDDF